MTPRFRCGGFEYGKRIKDPALEKTEGRAPASSDEKSVVLRELGEHGSRVAGLGEIRVDGQRALELFSGLGIVLLLGVSHAEVIVEVGILGITLDGLLEQVDGGAVDPLRVIGP